MSHAPSVSERHSSNPQWERIQRLAERYQCSVPPEQAAVRDALYLAIYEALPVLARVIVRKRSKGRYAERGVTELARSLEDRFWERRRVTQLMGQYDPARGALFYTW
ncbi:MAG: hypothetical protein ACRCTU_02950, partial [Zoogloea sp.]|uniref:hypothetical protein n=1 Tax=Zoogloea sp. TaxID=49181 RepID=UPI003F2F3976